MSIIRVGFLLATGIVSYVVTTFLSRKKPDKEAAALPSPYTKDHFVKIDKGTFKVGSLRGDPDERPEQTVTLSYDFLMAKSEITHAQFAPFWRATGRYVMTISSRVAGFKGAKHPQVDINWYDAVAYCKWVGKRLKGEKWVEEALKTTDWEVRLPLEVEWERAAKGGDGAHEYPTRTGSGTEDGIVYWENSANHTAEVGSKAGHYVFWGKPGTPFSGEIYDLAGNVWEWLQDSGMRGYNKHPVTDPTGPIFFVFKEKRGIRGGSWYFQRQFARSANRHEADTKFEALDLGARCVIAPKKPQR